MQDSCRRSPLRSGCRRSPHQRGRYTSGRESRRPRPLAVARLWAGIDLAVAVARLLAGIELPITVARLLAGIDLSVVIATGVQRRSTFSRLFTLPTRACHGDQHERGQRDLTLPIRLPCMYSCPLATTRERWLARCLMRTESDSKQHAPEKSKTSAAGLQLSVAHAVCGSDLPKKRRAEAFTSRGSMRTGSCAVANRNDHLVRLEVDRLRT